ETRIARRREDLERNDARQRELLDAITASEARLDADLRTFDELRDNVRVADERSQELRGRFEAQEAVIREARKGLEEIRSEVAQLDVARATAESDLAHLATACVEAVQAT